MKKTILALTISASVLALSACSGNNADEEVLVKSKAGNVTKAELYEEMKDAAGEQTLQLLVIEKVLDAKYKVTDEQVDKEIGKMKDQLGDSYEMYLAQQGQTEESLKKVIRLNLLQEAALVDGVELSDEEFEKQYKVVGTELNARHVLVADEKTALAVKKKLEGGADFAEVAKEDSTEEAAQQTGGELGWFGQGKMVPEFWDAASKLEVNKFSEPVKTEHGYHIIQVTEQRDRDKDEVRKELLLEKADQDSLLDKVSKIMKDAEVKVEDKDLKPTFDMFLNDTSAKEDETEEDKK